MLTHATALTPLELKSAIAREPLIVSPDTTVSSAIALMSGLRSLCATTKTANSQLDELHLEVRSSCVLVVENERILGILTERDVVRLIAQQQPLDRLVMQQVMAHPVVTLRESDFTDLFFAINLLQQHHIRHLPMLDEHDRLVGLVTHESLRQISRPIDLLRLRMVAEVMTSEVIVATPDCHLRAIAQLMANHRISSVMIVEQGSSSTEPLQIPLGIVTERDMVQFQVLGLNLDNCTAEAVMSTPIFAVKLEDSLWNVQQIMAQRLIRRLAVTGEQGELLGIVTQTSLLQALNPLELYKLVEVLDSKVVRLEAEKVALLENRNVELEQQVQARTVALETKAKQERLLNTIADHIRSSLNLQEILDTTAREIRSLLGCDRVIIYRFRPDFSGTVIAEAMTGTGRSMLNTEAHDPCVSAEWLEPYRNGKIRIIDDIYNEAMTQCDHELLVGFEIRAKLMVPIVVEEQLWGLMLASYRAVPHTWTTDEIELIRQVSLQLAIALQQATTHQRLQNELTKRRKVEVQLLDSEQRYATLVEASPVGIFRTDAVGNCIYVNDRYCQISGLTASATIGQGWQQGLHPDDRHWVTAEWEQLVQENNPFQLEYRFQHLDGTVFWVYGQSVAEWDANGQIVGYLGTVTDISDRKRTETQLQESEGRYATLVEASPVGIFRTDAVGNCIYVNDRWCQISGLTPTTAFGDGWREGLHPDDRVAIATEWQQSIEENRLFQLEYRFQRPDGKVTWVYGQSVSELDAEGQVVGYVGTVTDISDRKSAEQQLQQLNQELEAKIAERTQELWQVNNLQRAILDGADYSIISTDQTGIIQTFNAGAERMLGYSAAEMVGKATPELIHDRQEVINRATSLSQELKQNITPGFEVFVAKVRQGVVTEEEWTYINKDGSRFPVLLSITALKDANQQIIGFVGIAKDITDRKCAEQKRQQLVQELSAFKSALDQSAFVAITDAEGVITYVNDRFCEISGYSRDQAVGQTHRIVNSGYHPPSFFQDMWHTIASGGVWRGEICNRAKNGSLYWVASTIVPFVDEQGRPFQYLTIRFDITDRKFAETTLQQENSFRQQIVENMAEGLCVCDEIEEFPFVHFTVWNRQMQAITGYSLEDINRLGWYQRLYPDPEVQAQAIARTGRMRQGDNLIAEEWQIQRQDGQQRTIAISTSVLSSNNGQTYTLALIQDITDRRQTEQENSLLKQRFQFLLASSSAMIYSCKPYGDYGATFMSENIQAILGYQPEEFLTKSNFWASHIHPDDAPRIFANIPALFDHDIHNHEYRFLHRDGHYIWLRDEMRLVRDGEGNPLEIVGYFADISDQKQVEEELQESQAKFQRLVDDIGDKFVVFSHRGTSGLLTYVSDGVASVFGLRKQDIIGKPWMDLIDWLPEDVEIAHSSVIQMIENQVDFQQFDMRFIHPDGGQRTISVSQHPVRDQAGNPIAIEGIVENITDRKQVEAELKQVSERLSLSLKSGDIGCWELDIVQNTILWDERMYELYGLTKQLDTCIVYDTWANELHPDDRIPTETLIQQALLGQAEYDTEFRVIHPDGSLHFIKAYGVLVRDAQGKPQRMIGVNFDISDRKEAELRLQQQAKQERLLGSITQRVRSSLNLDEVLNTTVEEIRQVLQSDRALIYRVFPGGTGAAIAESVLPKWPKILDIVFPQEVFPEENYERYIQGRVYALSDREDENQPVSPCLIQFLAEIQVRAKLVVPIVQNHTLWGLLIIHQCDLPRQWEDWEINLLKQTANQLAIAIQQAGLFEQLQSELSERQQAQQKLTASNQQLAISNQELARATRLKDEFLANMSHELRTPLNAILGMSEGLQEQVFGSVNKEQIKALQTIERSGFHLLELINEILDVAKIESGQLELDLAPTAVSQLCQSSLAFVKQQALKKRIQLETKLPHNLPDLLVDERRILQVLINLLNNAVKFTPEGGHITLEVSRQQQAAAHLETADSPPQNYLRIAVIDTGIGIAPEHINKLFVPFIQIDSALNRQYQGTGLGLALVKRIVELHGGQVGLTSEVGVGSCFTIDLPCATSTTSSLAPETQPQPGIESSQSEIASPLILLAEDNEANISTISSYLRAKGYRLIVAKNGLEAIALTQSEHPDLILMDIQMPGMDGLEAMQQLRRDLKLVQVPIIALTALAMTGDRDRCLAAGANDYLSKPVKLKQLATTIQQLLTPQQEHP